MNLENNDGVAYTLLRLTMGFNMFGHGLPRLFKIAGFRDWMVSTFEKTLLPEWIVYSWGSLLPFIELTVGVLLILGLFTYRTAIVGATSIAILVLGSCLAGKFEWAGIQMIYGLFYYLLIRKVNNNAFSLDGLIKKQ